MDIRGASGTVLDHLFLVTREDARARIGISCERDSAESASARDEERARGRRLDARRGRVRCQGRLRCHRHRRIRRSRPASRSPEPCAATRRWRPFTAQAAAEAVRDIAADAAVYLSPFENHTRAIDALASGPSTALRAAARCGAIRPTCSAASAIHFCWPACFAGAGSLCHSRAWTFRASCRQRKSGS